MIPRTIRERFEESGLNGAIITSLLQEMDFTSPENFDRISIYLDGNWSPAHLEKAKKYSSEVLGIPESKIELISKGCLHNVPRIIHYARCVSTYLYKGKISLQELDENEHKRQIYLPKSYHDLYEPKTKKPSERIHHRRQNHILGNSSQYGHK
jgi:hypothetical protein